MFVHGLFGDTLGTWGEGQDPSFFQLITEDGAIGPRVDMLAFGYTSNMFSEGSFDIQEAANRLHSRLNYHGVLSYPAIVFVAHSMGGLVVLKELLTYRDVLPKVPVVVLYATPQEGSQITEIAQHVANNPALEQMLPANKNGYLRELNDMWRALPTRPTVVCGYEKRSIGGVVVVPWESATRFCDGPAQAIDADHIQIVKPNRYGHDSYVLLKNALNEFVIGQQLEPVLETPDFTEVGDQYVLNVSDPTIYRSARLVNAGGGTLRYTLARFPDRYLYVAPGTGPDTITSGSTKLLQFIVGHGVNSNSFQFTLTSNAGPDRHVSVEIADLGAIKAVQERLAASASDSLTELLTDGQAFQLLVDQSDQGAARQTVLQAVYDGVEADTPDLTEAARWLVSAEILNAVNWPNLAVESLLNVQRTDPATFRQPATQRLAVEIGELAGAPDMFERVDASFDEPDSAPPLPANNPWISNRNSGVIADRLQRVVPLMVEGFSLEGDLKNALGDTRAAGFAYRMAARTTDMPSIQRRLEALDETNAPQRQPNPPQMSPIDLPDENR